VANWNKNFESLSVNCSRLTVGSVAFIEHAIIELLQKNIEVNMPKKTTKSNLKMYAIAGIVAVSAVAGGLYQTYKQALKPADINIIAPTKVLYNADFNIVSPTTSTYHAYSFKLYPLNNALVMELPVSGQTSINSLTHTLPYTNPANSSYQIEFDVQITQSSDYNVWARLVTNSVGNNQYVISLHPMSSAYEIRKVTGANSVMIANGINAAIKKNGELNKVSFSRYSSTGAMMLTVNGVLATKIVDKEFVGGKNQLLNICRTTFLKDSINI